MGRDCFCVALPQMMVKINLVLAAHSTESQWEKNVSVRSCNLPGLTSKPSFNRLNWHWQRWGRFAFQHVYGAARRDLQGWPLSHRYASLINAATHNTQRWYLSGWAKTHSSWIALLHASFGVVKATKKPTMGSLYDLCEPCPAGELPRKTDWFHESSRAANVLLISALSCSELQVKQRFMSLSKESAAFLMLY